MADQPNSPVEEKEQKSRIEEAKLIAVERLKKFEADMQACETTEGVFNVLYEFIQWVEKEQRIHIDVERDWIEKELVPFVNKISAKNEVLRTIMAAAKDSTYIN